jgi:hypothetical protein
MRPRQWSGSLAQRFREDPQKAPRYLPINVKADTAAVSWQDHRNGEVLPIGADRYRRIGSDEGSYRVRNTGVLISLRFCPKEKGNHSTEIIRGHTNADFTIDRRKSQTHTLTITSHIYDSKLGLVLFPCCGPSVVRRGYRRIRHRAHASVNSQSVRTSYPQFSRLDVIGKANIRRFSSFLRRVNGSSCCSFEGLKFSLNSTFPQLDLRRKQKSAVRVPICACGIQARCRNLSTPASP